MSGKIVGIIGGSGLGDALKQQLAGAKSQEIETPFGKPSGPVYLGRLGETEVAFLNRHGPGHALSPAEVPYAANIFAMKKLGVHTIISSGAVGSLQENIAPGHLVIVDQFIDKTSKRTNSFFEGFAAVHCEMAEPVCRRLRKILIDTAATIDIQTHPKGTYVCMEGPQFSTRAESLMHRAWGGDLIGMTAMPEAKLAREAQICYALVALPSDYDCWRPHNDAADKQTLLQEIIANLQTASDNCIKLIKALLESNSELIGDDCPCRKSLDLAVWTDPSKIDASRKQELKILFQ